MGNVCEENVWIISVVEKFLNKRLACLRRIMLGSFTRCPGVCQ